MRGGIRHTPERPDVLDHPRVGEVLGVVDKKLHVEVGQNWPLCVCNVGIDMCCDLDIYIAHSGCGDRNPGKHAAAVCLLVRDNAATVYVYVGIQGDGVCNMVVISEREVRSAILHKRVTRHARGRVAPELQHSLRVFRSRAACFPQVPLEV